MMTRYDWEREPNVVVLEGPEAYEKERHIRQAIEALGDYEVHVTDAQEGSSGMVESLLYDSPLIPVKRMIVIRSANRIKDKEILEAYCERPNSNNVVVLEATPGRLPKWFKDLKRNGTVKCEKPKPWEMKEWVKTYFIARGYTISLDLADAICANVGDSLYLLANEIDKIILNMGEGETRVGARDITSVLVQHQAISPFKTIESWCMKDTVSSLRMAAIYFQQNSQGAIPLIATFLSQIERMILFVSMRNSGFGKGDLLKEMGITSYVYEQVERQVMHWNLVELRKAYSEMVRIDQGARRGEDGTTLMYWFLSRKTT